MSATTFSPSQSPLPRSPGLDGIRAIAVLMVVFRHASGPLVQWQPGIFDNVFFRAFANGALGVTIFFVLSGYLITTILMRDAGLPARELLTRFYVKRVLRIFPVYFTFLLFILFASQYWLAALDLKSWWSAIFFWFNYYHGRTGAAPIAHLWSLSVEEQFYILWSLGFVWLYKHPLRNKWLLLLVALAPFIRVIQVFSYSRFNISPLHFDTETMFHTRYDSLLVGCLLALNSENKSFQQALHKIFSKWWISYPAILAIFVLPALPNRHWYYVTYRNVVALPLANLCIAGWIWIAHYSLDKNLAWWMNSRLMQFLGKISFSVYIWHNLVLNIPGLPVYYALPLVFLVGYLSYRFIGKSGINLKEAWIQRRNRAYGQGIATKELITFG